MKPTSTMEKGGKQNRVPRIDSLTVSPSAPLCAADTFPSYLIFKKDSGCIACEVVTRVYDQRLVVIKFRFS